MRGTRSGSLDPVHLLDVNNTSLDKLSTTLTPDAGVDAFGRRRASNPLTIFDSKQIFDNAPLVWDDQEVSGSGTSSTYSSDTASTVLAVSANTSGKRVRQTKMRFNYQPGKSQLVFMTGTMVSGGGTGITRAMGLFDDNNGILSKDNQGTTNLIVRSSTTGSPVDDAFPRNEWNLDRLNGNGPSGISFNPDASQILAIDYEWLAVGRVRVGFVIGGRIIYCHQFNHANIVSGAYMSTPNLPLRYEIENDGTGVASELEHICTTVISEGGQEKTGVLRYRSTAGTAIQAVTAGTLYAVLGIRLKTTHLAATIDFENVSFVNGGNADYEWVQLLNPTLAAAVTFADETNSAVQTAVGNAGTPSTSTVTGGTRLAGGVVKGGVSTGATDRALLNALRLGATIDGTRDEMYFCVRPFSANATMNGGLQWREAS